MDLPLKLNYHKYYSVPKEAEEMEFSSSDGFEDELWPQWKKVQKRLQEIEKDEWVRIWKMKFQEIAVPGGKSFYEYCVGKIDPENIIFRRKKRKREDDNCNTLSKARSAMDADVKVSSER